VVVLSAGVYSYHNAQPGSKHYAAELDDAKGIVGFSVVHL